RQRVAKREDEVLLLDARAAEWNRRRGGDAQGAGPGDRRAKGGELRAVRGDDAFDVPAADAGPSPALGDRFPLGRRDSPEQPPRPSAKHRSGAALHRDPAGEVQVPPEALDDGEARRPEELLVPGRSHRDEDALEPEALPLDLLAPVAVRALEPVVRV